MPISSTYIKNVFCLEGEMGRDLRDGSSMKAALDFMRANFGVKSIYRQCHNRSIMQYYIKRWKNNRKYDSYSIIYLHFHGEKGKIEPGGRGFVTIDELGEMMKDSCENKMVHFGTCETIKVGDAEMVEFLKKTKALCVSGYKADVDFFQSSIFDLILIDLFQKYRDVSKIQNAIDKNYKQLAEKLDFKLFY